MKERPVELERAVIAYHQAPIIFHRVFLWLERASCHKVTMCLLAAAMPMAIRIAVLSWIPIPQPHVHDEFSYLLGAQTFASGRLTNPKHPMWVHFETFHELMQPTYMSKYPPGQALFLAMGWKLLGHPWFGVWISYGIFCACLCWMLQNWVPPVYAVLGTAITLTKISFLGYWMNSYWGGAVAASAGCLLLGTLPRLARRVDWKDAGLAATGLVLLANTRPYEGLVMSAAAFLALLYWRARGKQSFVELLSFRFVIPFALICGGGALLDGYYNYRITGNAFVIPYSVYSQQYAIAPPLIILPERTPPSYQHAVLEKFWKGPDLQNFLEIRPHPLSNLAELARAALFFCSPLYLFPVALGILLCGSYRAWTAAAICVVVWSGFFLESIKWPHYIAGGVGLLPVLAAYGFRLLRVTSRKYGTALVVILATLLCATAVERSTDPGGEREAKSHFLSLRTLATQTLSKQGGRHLILVRYSSNHDPGFEYVYNSADIDGSQIIWARDMGEVKNRELVDYYRGGRQVWLFQPDTDPAPLIPYKSASGVVAP